MNLNHCVEAWSVLLMHVCHFKFKLRGIRHFNHMLKKIPIYDISRKYETCFYHSLIRLSLLICHNANCKSYYLKISSALQKRSRAVVPWKVL